MYGYYKDKIDQSSAVTARAIFVPRPVFRLDQFRVTCCFGITACGGRGVGRRARISLRRFCECITV